MRVFAVTALLITAAVALSVAFASGIDHVTKSPPSWAYGTDPAASRSGVAAGQAAGSDSALKHLSGSDLEFTEAQIQDHFAPADWFPNDHGVMPEVVAHGRKPNIWACALCHYPNGKGKPENASVAGLPVTYFVEQMHEFRDGLRKTADPRKTNTALMSAIAKAMSDEEIGQAAAYFCGIKWTAWIKVVETRTVPKTRISLGLYIPVPGAESEPISRRIIEIPADPEGTEELRNPRSGFVAYVPVGSLQQGAKLVTKGLGRTSACGGCHGADLKGLGPVPGIAGRSPSYLVRQMYDMQQGTRAGAWTELMKPVVNQLSEEDMLSIAAYTASLQP